MATAWLPTTFLSAAVPDGKWDLQSEDVYCDIPSSDVLRVTEPVDLLYYHDTASTSCSSPAGDYVDLAYPLTPANECHFGYADVPLHGLCTHPRQLEAVRCPCACCAYAPTDYMYCAPVSPVSDVSASSPVSRAQISLHPFTGFPCRSPSINADTFCSSPYSSQESVCPSPISPQSPVATVPTIDEKPFCIKRSSSDEGSFPINPVLPIIEEKTTASVSPSSIFGAPTTPESPENMNVFDRFIDESKWTTTETGGLLGKIDLFGDLLPIPAKVSGLLDATDVSIDEGIESNESDSRLEQHLVDNEVNDMDESDTSDAEELITQSLAYDHSQTVPSLIAACSSDDEKEMCNEQVPVTSRRPGRPHLSVMTNDMKPTRKRSRSPSADYLEEIETPAVRRSRMAVFTYEEMSSEEGEYSSPEDTFANFNDSADAVKNLTSAIVWRKNSAGRYICPHRGCSKTFERKFNGSTHYATHFDVRMHACPVCCKTFTRSYDLKRHQKLHKSSKCKSHSPSKTSDATHSSTKCANNKKRTLAANSTPTHKRKRSRTAK
ncbi:hypothetical protein SpCBS45565_g03373 [Spizellomyces sp. 'palustris']|nr:hypothetical protein SpCBS45565_g03373 [Spizellomyces sp. 'palustris']